MTDSKESDYPYIKKISGKNLIFLCSLSQHDSQADTARALGVRNGWVTEQKQKLERLLNLSLTDDEGITDDAKKLGKRLGPILRDLEVALSQREKEIHIGLTHFIAGNFLDDIINVTQDLWLTKKLGFRVKVRLIEDTIDVLERQLESGAIDLLVGGVSVDHDDLSKSSSDELALTVPYSLVSHTNFKVNNSQCLSEAYTFSALKFWHKSREFSWVINGKGTATRRLLEEKWGVGIRQALDQSIAEAADERVMLNIVQLQPDGICLLPLGPNGFNWLNGGDNFPYQWHVLPPKDLPNVVRVIARSRKGSTEAISIVEKRINKKIAQSMIALHEKVNVAKCSNDV